MLKQSLHTYKMPCPRRISHSIWIHYHWILMMHCIPTKIHRLLVHTKVIRTAGAWGHNEESGVLWSVSDSTIWLQQTYPILRSDSSHKEGQDLRSVIMAESTYCTYRCVCGFLYVCTCKPVLLDKTREEQKLGVPQNNLRICTLPEQIISQLSSFHQTENTNCCLEQRGRLSLLRASLPSISTQFPIGGGTTETKKELAVRLHSGNDSIRTIRANIHKINVLARFCNVQNY